MGNCLHNNSPNKGQIYRYNLYHFGKDLLQQIMLQTSHLPSNLNCSQLIQQLGRKSDDRFPFIRKANSSPFLIILFPITVYPNFQSVLKEYTLSNNLTSMGCVWNSYPTKIVGNFAKGLNENFILDLWVNE